MAALESAGLIGGIGGVVVMISCMTAFNWNVIVSGIIGLTIGFVLAFIGVIVITERNDRKKKKD
ncbi:MAG TPA: hypothetical protein VGK13_04490 [Methanocellaceae archaeon]